jgi:ubiquinone/menaquinone biosynthesis C-methylase UbiE
MDYDQLATEYARHRKIHPDVLQQLVESGRVSGSSRVLEVGCGTGNYLSAIHAMTGCAATGLDPSDGMLATAREQLPNATLLLGQGELLPFDDAAFDLVYSVDVIHHIGDRPAFFREARRVLAPGGRICTATDSAEDIARRVPLSSHFPETVEIELARYPRIETLSGEMRGAGLATARAEQVELEYELTDFQPYRDRAYSSLHLISEAAIAAGLARMEADLERGPIRALSLYTLLWGTA